ncbi:hypothetical protein [Roseovarius aestuariivivens]|uniref:hypothetical protein n=1 Tax=Roseovarius aestuariivivens TaxID=1888910 RepID=UPI001080856C|nr:hypothetical protein [Roseovarius aestuariivivens]
MIRFILAALVAALLLPVPQALAQDPLAPIPAGRCMLVVSSQPSLAHTRNYILTEAVSRKFMQVFPSSNGWYAIAVGSLRPEERDGILSAWKASGRIPGDSFCTTGASFRAPIDWRKLLPRDQILNEEGYYEHLEPDGTLIEASIDGSFRRITHPDGEVEVSMISMLQVQGDALPPLGQAHSDWANALTETVDELSERILLPHEHETLQTAATGDFFDSTLFKLRVLRKIMEGP